MDAVKLEKIENDQLEIIKYRPQLTPHLSGADFITQSTRACFSKV